MSAHIPKGFFAYPSQPLGLGETVRAAIDKINQGGSATVRPWEECRVGGKIIVAEICKEIDHADFFCADLTRLNPNVMFELGYAIARDRRIWLILDTSISASQTQFEQLRILTTVGYASYCNSDEIVREFYRDQPQYDLGSTIFRQAIRPNLGPTTEHTLLYLKSRHETEASVRVTKRVQTTGLLGVRLIVDDPRESAVQTLTWYGTQVFGADAVVCHLTDPERDGARLHNARHSLVAGMAVGMERRLLMLAEGELLAPMDYRELLKTYAKPSEAVGRLDEFLVPIEGDVSSQEATRLSYSSAVRVATELRGLRLGEFVAENEVDRLVRDYFVETAPYREAMEGRHAIFIGRKGCGKTANLLKLAEELRADPRNLVCVVKPVAYQLHGVVELLKRYKERDAKGHAIESLWKFLLYTEIALAVVREIEARPSRTLDGDEDSLVNLLHQQAGIFRDDFSVRLERCVEGLVAAKAENAGMEESRLAISEALHQGVLRELRLLLGRVLRRRQLVSVLVDNLDKAWDKKADIPSLAEFLLGLLSAPNNIRSDFRHDDKWREPVNLGLTIFLRSDIFYKLLSSAREPDKITHSRIAWNDPELLLRVIEERFVASHAGNVAPVELWERYFCPRVNGLPTKSYLLARILPRPRDLIFLVKAAIAIAVNRGHPVVTESDIVDAEKQYSQYALESIIVENGLGVRDLESVLYEFVASGPYLGQAEVESRLAKTSVAGDDYPAVIDHLSGLTFLGLEVAENDFRFAEDPHEYRKTLVMARRFAESRRRPPRYKINPAFWAFLEIAES